MPTLPIDRNRRTIAGKDVTPSVWRLAEAVDAYPGSWVPNEVLLAVDAQGRLLRGRKPPKNPRGALVRHMKYLRKALAGSGYRLKRGHGYGYEVVSVVSSEASSHAISPAQAA